MDHIFKTENRKRISGRLQYRIVIFLVISVVLLALLAYNVAIGIIVWWMGVLALVVGLIIGFIYGRLTRIAWHETEEKIIIRMDMIGYILIAGYIALSFIRDWLLGDILTGAALTAISLAIVSGILLGRFLGLHISIMRMLREGR